MVRRPFSLRGRRTKKAFATVIGLFIPIILSEGNIAAGKTTDMRPHILFIASYSPSFPSFFDQIDGFRAGMREQGFGKKDYVLDVEFLDSKRFPYALREKQLDSELRIKLPTLQPYRMIVTADDNALKFAKKRLDGLFAGADLVFLGVNNIKFATAQNDHPRIVGVVEKRSLGESLELAQRLFPHTGDIHVVTDGTPTGLTNRRQLESELNERPNIRAHIFSLADSTYDQLFDHIKSLAPSTPLFLNSVYRDGAGVHLPFLDFLARLRTVFQGPVFMVQQHGIGSGVFGGKVVSHYEQGRTAAGLAAAILKGTPAAKFKVIGDSPNVFKFDYDEVRRLGLSIDWLPAGSEFVNRPSSILDQYSEWVMAGSVIFVFQFGLIVMLVHNNRRRRAAEKALQHAAQAAESANQAKSAFLSNMSHELRTPLNSIIGFSELIKNSAMGPLGNERYVQFIDDIYSSGNHLLKLINAVLDLSKIDAGHMTLDERSTDMERLARETIRQVGPLADAKSIDLVYSPATKPILVHGDETKLKQIILNLLSNAIKFSENQGEVRLEVVADPVQGLRLSVQDRGIGMREEHIAIALSPFGQVEDPLTRSHDGTGLGLPLAKKLAELHDGTLTVESEPGVGTTITITLPPSRLRMAESKAA